MGIGLQSWGLVVLDLGNIFAANIFKLNISTKINLINYLIVGLLNFNI